MTLGLRKLLFLSAVLPLLACGVPEEEAGAIAPGDSVEQVEQGLAGCSANEILASAPPGRLAILERGVRWVNLGVMYSQTGTFDGYRRDCSGFVSMTWGLSTPGATTSTLPAYAHNIGFGDLVPGDVLNKPGSHAMLFAGWAGSTMCVLQENRTGTPANISGFGSSYYGSFQPIRFNTLPPGAYDTPPRQVALYPYPTACGEIEPGRGLGPGQSIWSCDGRHRLVVQADGNLVLYSATAGATWSTSTPLGFALNMQTDGNLVLYTQWGYPLWSSGTAGRPGAVAKLQNDGNLVVYQNGAAVWQSGTYGR